MPIYREDNNYIPNIDYSKADLPILVESGKLTYWLKRIGNQAYKKNGKITSSDFKEAFLKELFPYYLSKGKRERSTIVLNLPLAIVVLAQRNSITDVCISMFAYQGLKDAEKECDDVPKMTNDDISQYISDLVELKIPKLL